MAFFLGSAMLLLAATISAGGCRRSGPPPRKLVPVSGTVTLDGKPLPDGFASFVTPTEGHLETFPIKDGKFAGKAGLGPRMVQIIAIRVAVSESKPDPRAPPPKVQANYLPAKYSGASSELTADVTEKGPNTFTFDLTMGK